MVTEKSNKKTEEESDIVLLMTIASQMPAKEVEKLVWIGQGIVLARDLGGKRDE